MVGTAMQGGCTCENACYLRIDTGNVEIAALTAPRPLGMTSADDWTKEILTKGLPELKQLYRLFGAEDLVMAKPLLQFPHNYNYVSRAVMYSWMNKHLKLGFTDPIVEEDFKPLSIAEMTVWDKKHPKPCGGEDYERSLLKWVSDDSDRRMAGLVPRNGASLACYREVVGGALEAMVGREVPKAGNVVAASRETRQRGEYRVTTMLLRYAAQKEELPAVLIEPKGNWNEIVICTARNGKRSLLAEAGDPTAAIRGILNRKSDGKAAVLGVDLIGQGEFTPDGTPWAKARLLRTDRYDRSLAFTLGYNPPLFVQRVHDILSVISYVKATWPKGKKVTLRGLDGSGPWVAAAPRSPDRWSTLPSSTRRASASPRSPPWTIPTCYQAVRNTLTSQAFLLSRRLMSWYS